MMKKLTSTFFAFLILAGLNVSAQDFQIFGGLNISKIREGADDGTYSDKYDNLIGQNIGFKVAFETNSNSYFETGLFLSNKGFKMSGSETIDGVKMDVDATVSLQYLEIPLNAKSSIEADKGVNLYATYGIFLGIGIDARMKVKASVMGETEEEIISLDFGSDPEEDFFKQFDLGVAFGAGVEIQRFLIGLNYSYGLLNISPMNDGGYYNRSRALSIMLGYKIPGDKPAKQEQPTLYP